MKDHFIILLNKRKLKNDVNDIEKVTNPFSLWSVAEKNAGETGKNASRNRVQETTANPKWRSEVTRCLAFHFACARTYMW